MKKLFAIILFVSVGLVSSAQPAFIAFGDNEALAYEVSYRAKFFPNTPAATVIVKTTKNNQNNTYEIWGNGKSLSSYKWFFDLNDTYRTILDGNTLLPIEASCELKEAKYRFVNKFTYDWKNMVVNTMWQNLARPNANYKTMPLEKESLDAVALFFNLRQSDLSTFVPGKQLYLRVVLEDTIRTIGYKYLGRDRIKIKGTGTYKTLKFSCSLATSTGESFEDGSEFFLWISDDDNRIPILIESPIKIGSIRARLTDYSGLRHELTSKVK